MINRFSLLHRVFLCYILLVMAACKKGPEVTLPDFDVSTGSTTVAAAMPVTFTFSGNAGSIVFWAGDSARNYAFRRRDTVGGGKPYFQFSTLRQFGLNAGIPDSSLQLMVSADFNGNLSRADLLQASWRNISGRAAFSTGASSLYTPSGFVDLSDIIPRDSAGVRTPVYLAFRYYDNETRSSKRGWYTKDYSIDYIFPDSTRANIAGPSMGWGTIAVKNFMRTWYIYASSSLMWGGDATFPETEHWLISQPLFLNRVNPDIGISVKTNPTTIQTTYTFSGYPQPGIYTAVFLATNANKWDKKTVEKSITITVK